MGFPGNLTAEATYELGDNYLAFHYRATTDAPTIVSLTNHGYWNLSGEQTIANHTLAVASDRVLTIGSDIVPTGGFTDVANTPLDLRSPVRLGEALDALPSGFDHCYVIRGTDLDPHDTSREQRIAAVLAGGSRWMTVSTDCPGLQVYTGNALRAPFVPHASVSLETQRFPDAPNHPNFGPFALLPGQEYRSTTVLAFGVGTPPEIA
jgi:aldose 1-epimerase